jgi:benzoyl-CoA reductase subunit C
MDALKEFDMTRLTQLSQEEIAGWKSKGKKIIGYTCLYVPEEIIYAADMLPIRIFGGTNGSHKGELVLQVNICSFIRSCLGEVLEGRYHFLDGLITARTCGQMAKLHDVWQLYGKTHFMYMIDHPHRVSKFTNTYYKKELQRFIAQLEEFGKVKITSEALTRAIKLCNENRGLLKEVYQWRNKGKGIKIWGHEVIQAVRGSMMLPKEKSNALIKRLLDELKDRRDITPNNKPRILITGSMLDNPAFIKVVEDAGAIVVSDDLCMGSRYFWDQVKLEDDPLDALVSHYLEKIPCPFIHPRERRFQHIINLAQDFQVDGVIIFLIKFCDNFVYDSPDCIDMLKRHDIPALEIEIEHSTVSIGQVKTRVQAFLEMLSRA